MENINVNARENVDIDTGENLNTNARESVDINPGEGFDMKRESVDMDTSENSDINARENDDIDQGENDEIDQGESDDIKNPEIVGGNIIESGDGTEKEIVTSKKRECVTKKKLGNMDTVNLLSFKLPGKKRTDLSVDQKLQVLCQLQKPGATLNKVARQFNISKSQAGRIKKASEQLQTFEKHSPHLASRKRVRYNDDGIGGPLFNWTQDKFAEGVKLTGPMLKEKAKEIAQGKNITFTASNGWLWRWKSRYGLTCNLERAEKLHPDTDTNDSDKWINTILPCLLRKFAPDNIFNADEMSFYYRYLPNKVFDVAGNEICSGQLALQQMTVLLCSNMSGSDKLPLYVIGKPKHPRCFPADGKGLPVHYRSNKNAWMTASLFREWLEDLDVELRAQNRKILLLLDNCSAHPNVPNLRMITLCFMPLNIASIMQPMVMGAMQNFKGHFRSILYNRVNGALNTDPSYSGLRASCSITLLDALYMARQAWSRVKPETIATCFRKAGFNLVDEKHYVNDGHDIQFDDLPEFEGFSKKDFLSWVTMDDDLPTNGEPSDEDLSLTGDTAGDPKRLFLDEGQSTQSDPDGDEDDIYCPLSILEKATMLNYLRQFVQENAMEELVSSVEMIQEMIFNEANPNKSEQDMVYTGTGHNKSEYHMVFTDPAQNKPEQDVVFTEAKQTKPKQRVVYTKAKQSKPKKDGTPRAPRKTKPKQANTNNTVSTDAGQNKQKQDNNMVFNEPRQNKPKPEMPYTEVRQHNPEQNMIFTESRHNKPRQDMVFTEARQHIPEQGMIFTEARHNKPRHDMVFPDVALNRPRQDMVFPDTIHNKPRQDMVFPDTIHNKPRQDMVFPDSLHNKQRQDMIFPETSHSHNKPRQDMVFPETSHSHNKPRQDMIFPETSHSHNKPRQDMIFPDAGHNNPRQDMIFSDGSHNKPNPFTAMVNPLAAYHGASIFTNYGASNLTNYGASNLTNYGGPNFPN